MYYFVLSLIGATCWGIAPVFGKIGLKGVQPLDGLAARTIVTVILVGTWIFLSGGLTRISAIPGRNWAYLSVEAFLATFAGDIAYYAAIKGGDIGLVGLVLAAAPVITLGIGNAFLREPLSLEKILGAVLICGGVILIGFSQV